MRRPVITGTISAVAGNVALKNWFMRIIFADGIIFSRRFAVANKVVFLLDNDKDFLTLYSRLLQSKGCRVFATDNLFLLLKYAKTVLPEWIFIDEDFVPRHEKELVRIIDKNLPSCCQTYFAIMSSRRDCPADVKMPRVKKIYKQAVWEKMLEITKNGCNLH